MYAKLFQQVLTSSLTEREPLEVRGLFFMLLAAADKDGVVLGSDTRIAQILNIPKEQFDRCLAALMNPDPDSRNPAHEGRRVIRFDACQGLALPSYALYSGLVTDEQRRKANRNRQAAYRAEQKAKCAEALPKSDDPSIHPAAAMRGKAAGVLGYISELVNSKLPASEKVLHQISERLAEVEGDVAGVKKALKRHHEQLIATNRLSQFEVKWMFSESGFLDLYKNRDLPVESGNQSQPGRKLTDEEILRAALG